MFGKNEVAKARSLKDGFMVKEIFYTIQGEGPWVGQPAVFLRLAGCNLRCFFCDTDFAGGTHYTLDGLADYLNKFCWESRCHYVVITGGEPMLQEIGALINHASLYHSYWQIETAGTVWPESMSSINFAEDRVLIVVSPKTPRLHPLIERTASAYKYIVRAGELSVNGLPLYSTQSPTTMLAKKGLAKPTFGAEIYVQPCDEGPDNDAANLANRQEALRSAMKHGYKLSLQMHKILGMP